MCRRMIREAQGENCAEYDRIRFFKIGQLRSHQEITAASMSSDGYSNTHRWVSSAFRHRIWDEQLSRNMD